MDNDLDKLVIWEKWRDPFGMDDDIEDDVDDEESDPDSMYNGLEDNKSKQHINQPEHIRVMATPMGIIPITENTASSRIFNFWTGHTNFNITPKIASIIAETDGVESLDVFTRYRFRISVGKAFEDSSVMRNINKHIYTYLG